MAPTTTFPAVITADRWESVWEAALLAAKRRRNGAGGSFSAPLTNGEAASLVRAWPGKGALWMPLWYQFAATAYGWDPAKSDRLNTSAKQREEKFELSRDLWDITHQLARSLDADNVKTPRLDIDSNTFDDPTFQGGVRAALRDDGAMRDAAKIPIACKDKNGKLVAPKMKCKPGWKLEHVWGTPFYVCRNPKTGETEQPNYECEDETVYIDVDPITAIGRALAGDLGKLALIVGFGYLVFKEKR